ASPAPSVAHRQPVPLACQMSARAWTRRCPRHALPAVAGPDRWSPKAKRAARAGRLLSFWTDGIQAEGWSARVGLWAVQILFAPRLLRQTLGSPNPSWSSI